MERQWKAVWPHPKVRPHEELSSVEVETRADVRVLLEPLADCVSGVAITVLVEDVVLEIREFLIGKLEVLEHIGNLREFLREAGRGERENVRGRAIRARGVFQVADVIRAISPVRGPERHDDVATI